MTEKADNTTTQQTEDLALLKRPSMARFKPEDLVVIQNLVGAGVNVADIGMLMGYEGVSWRNSAAQSLGSKNVTQAIENGLRLAEAQMVSDLIKDANGYEYEEVRTTYKFKEKTDPVTGKFELVKIPVGETRTMKRVPGSSRLKELLVCNRLPQVFKKVSEVRRASFKVESKMSDEQIDELIGRLLDKTDTKTIDSKVVETENEDEHRTSSSGSVTTGDGKDSQGGGE